MPDAIRGIRAVYGAVHRAEYRDCPYSQSDRHMERAPVIGHHKAASGEEPHKFAYRGLSTIVYDTVPHQALHIGTYRCLFRVAEQYHPRPVSFYKAVREGREILSIPSPVFGV